MHLRDFMRILSLFLLALLIVLFASCNTRVKSAKDESLFIVVTFPNLKLDVELIKCEDDHVVWLVPPGIDPHDYQLSPSDIEKLRRADLIVSTSHAPFEMRIRELMEKGEITATLVEIPKIPGIRIFKNPATGEPNLHMIIYDPLNYKVFLRYLAKIMSTLRPAKGHEYMKRADDICTKVDVLLNKAPSLDLIAVADVPVVQYAVTWLGIEVKYLMVKEHGVPATPQDIEVIKSAIEHGGAQIAVILRPALLPPSKTLETMAKEHDIPIIYVPSPLSVNSTLDKLKYILLQVHSISLRARRRSYIPVLYVDVKWILVMIAAAMAYGFLSPMVAVRRLRFLSAASSHAALLSITLAIALTRLIGIFNEYIWAILLSLLLMYLVGYMIYKGTDPDAATSVFVAFSASASIISMYFILTRYPIEVDLWAVIIGDPLLASWNDVIYALVIAFLIAISVSLTYKENVCIGVERDCALIAGIRVMLYDWLIYTLLGLAAIAMIKVVGFVLEHILILLPSTIAALYAHSAQKALVASVIISLVASLGGLFLAIILNQAPSGTVGLILMIIYLTTLLITKAKR